MAFLKKLLKGVKQKMADVFLGEPLREWGVVYEQRRRFFSEAISVDLYQNDGKPVLWLKATYKSRISYNSYGFAITVYELRDFVETLQSRYGELCRLAGTPRPMAVNPRDRLPLAHRLLIKAIHGIRASMLLLDYRDPVSNATDYRFYGYVTRKSDNKIFIQSGLDIANREGSVISGEGFAAALQVLADFLDTEESVALLSR